MRLNFRTHLTPTLNFRAISSSSAYLNYKCGHLWEEIFSFGSQSFLYSGLHLLWFGIKKLLLTQLRRNSALFWRSWHFSFVNSANNYVRVMTRQLSLQMHQRLLDAEAWPKSQQPFFHYGPFDSRLRNFFWSVYWLNSFVSTPHFILYRPMCTHYSISYSFQINLYSPKAPLALDLLRTLLT